MSEYDDFLNDFASESLEALDVIEDRIMAMECGDTDALDAVFRAMHSLKGGSSFVDLFNVNKLAHQLENLLDEVRNGERTLCSNMVDILLRGSDRLRNIMKDVHNEESAEINDLIDEIKTIQESNPAVTQQPLTSKQVSVSASEPQSDTSNISLTKSISNITEKETLPNELRFGAFLVQEKLLTCEQVLSAMSTQMHQELSPLIALQSTNLNPEEILKICDESALNGIHPFIIAEAWHTDIQAKHLFSQIKDSRPAFGKILAELDYCSSSEARTWFQAYSAFLQGEEINVEPASNSICSENVNGTKTQESFPEEINAADFTQNDNSPIEDEIHQQANVQKPVTQHFNEECTTCLEEQTKAHFSITLPTAVKIDCERHIIEDFLSYFNNDLHMILENSFLAIEESNGEALKNILNNLYRELHSLKGSSGFIGANLCNGLIHNMEDCLSAIQQHLDTITSDELAIFTEIELQGLDLLWNLRAHIEKTQDENDFLIEHHESCQLFISELTNFMQRLIKKTQEAPQEAIEDLF